MRTAFFAVLFWFSVFEVAAQNDPLLIAANFALRGKDGGNFYWVNRKDCILGFLNSDENGAWKWVFYLNKIDPMRIQFWKHGPTIENPKGYFSAEVRGEALIYEMHSEPTALGRNLRPPYPTLYWRNTNLEISYPAAEIDRAMRAWKYVYSNGCTGSRSAF